MITSKRLLAVLAAFAVVLLFFVAVFLARVIDRHQGARLRLGGAEPAGLASSTQAYLRDLRGRITLTYFVTARRAMPSSMKGVEDAVTRMLRAWKEAAPDRVDYRVIDPDASPEHGAAYASSKAVSPIKLRRVLQDESSETTVWSSLALAHDQHQDGFVQAITPDDLPYLEDLVVETLRASASVTQPVISVAAPGRGYASVREYCISYGNARVAPLDLDRETRIPHDSDLLLWIEPRTATREHAQELERYLASGRSAIVAGSTYNVDYLARDAGKFGYRIAQSGTDWGTFLRPFGLSLRPALVVDKNHEAISWRRDGGLIKVDAPFHIRVLPTLFDTRSLLGPNAGALLVSSVSPIGWDPRAVSACGRRAEVIATTSEHVRVLDLPESEFDDALLAEAPTASKQPWMVLLKPDDPWKGDLILVGSPTLFHDDPYAQGGNANQTFFRTLLRTYTAPTRLARIRVPRHDPAPIPSLSLASRVSWRAFTVLLVPAVLLFLALRRARSRPLGPRRLPWARPAALGVVALVAILVFSRVLGTLWFARADMTEDSINTPSPLTSKLLAGVSSGLDVELLSSESHRMPPELKGVEARLLAALRGLGMRPRVTRPEDLAPVELAKLRAAGIQSFDVDYVVDDAPASAKVWSALRLAQGGKSEVIPRLDSRSVEHLEFLLVAAVNRLRDGRTPVVGVLSDLPRLTPAEAHTDYQQKGYTAPVGSDVYSLSKRLLETYGYRLVYINPEAPVYPEKMDLLVWLQPRFPQRSWGQFTRYMTAGGKAFIAIQHYNVQQRQYRGAGFKTVYWPQPQFHNFNDYLKLLGVDQLGDKRGEAPAEVLFDRQHADLLLETQVNRSAFREHDPQQVSRPFLIRVAGEGLSAQSVVTSRLRNLLFIWGNRFALDEAKLGQLGFKHQVLVTTSPRAWTYAWSGGWIPDESFAEPAQFLPGTQKLGFLLEGQFPRIEVKKDEQGRDSLTVVGAEGAPASPGQLLMIGCSEMFKNAHLQAPGYQHDQLLLNAVAALVHGPELAEIQARTRTPKVFPYQPNSTKQLWRAIVLGAAPALFVLYGLVRFWWRRRPLLVLARRSA